ncbi:hypothetical protein AVEN_32826-1 [Araneus ventricosus]|uniref:Uncharacterized protein n=1 Tax=Araneus ventricosus TaxID=182803 RepID=A0A4Y2E0H7_ARAVE|nr:hypothetical protein AVEN_32826-1 [Araneus ventricosus]
MTAESSLNLIMLLISKCLSNIQYIFESLLENGKIVIPCNEGLARQTQTRGCPHGSCSGPDLWNLVAEGALKAEYPVNTSSLATESLKIFKNWSDKHGRTRFLHISNLRRGPSIFWGNERVKRTDLLRYLGVYLNKKMKWTHHFVQQGAKALQ